MTKYRIVQWSKNKFEIERRMGFPKNIHGAIEFCWVPATHHYFESEEEADKWLSLKKFPLIIHEEEF